MIATATKSMLPLGLSHLELEVGTFLMLYILSYDTLCNLAGKKVLVVSRKRSLCQFEPILFSGERALNN